MVKIELEKPETVLAFVQYGPNAYWASHEQYTIVVFYDPEDQWWKYSIAENKEVIDRGEHINYQLCCAEAEIRLQRIIDQRFMVW